MRSHGLSHHLDFLDGLSQMSPILEFTKIRPLGAVLMHVDRQTYMTKQIGAFCECANVSKTVITTALLGMSASRTVWACVVISCTALERVEMPCVAFCFCVCFWARLQNCEKRLLASSCPSVRMEQLGSHWTDFYEILYLSTCRISVEKIQISLKSDKNNGYYT